MVENGSPILPEEMLIPKKDEVNIGEELVMYSAIIDLGIPFRVIDQRMSLENRIVRNVAMLVANLNEAVYIFNGNGIHHASIQEGINDFKAGRRSREECHRLIEHFGKCLPAALIKKGNQPPLSPQSLVYLSALATYDDPEIRSVATDRAIKDPVAKRLLEEHPDAFKTALQRKTANH